MRTLIGSLLVMTLLIGCAQAQRKNGSADAATGAASAAPSPIEIADGRGGWPATDAGALGTSPPVVQAIDAARKHWSAENPGYEERLIIRSVATGSFTRPGAEQQLVLFLMSAMPRCCPSMGLAILEGGRLVRNIAFVSNSQAVWTLPDLDGDGRNELAFGGTFMMGGQVSSAVFLASFDDEGPKDLGSVPVFDDTCGAGYENVSASRLFVTPGSPFMAEYFEKVSCDSDEWQRTGGPEPIVLTPDENSEFFDIPLS